MAKHVVLVAHGEPTTLSFGDHLDYSWRLMHGVARSTADHSALVLPFIALSRARARPAVAKARLPLAARAEHARASGAIAESAGAAVTGGLEDPGRLRIPRAVPAGCDQEDLASRDGDRRADVRCGFGVHAHDYGRGDRWTAPPIRDTLRRVSEAGFQEVVYFPYGFLADNSESQLFGKLAVASRPELRVRYVPCLNGSFELAEAIAAEIVKAR